MANSSKQIECPRCGQFNPPQARYCMYCGEKLVEKKSTHEKDNKHANLSNSNKKELNVKVLYILLFTLIIAGILILYFAGVFSSPKVTIKNSNLTKHQKENTLGVNSTPAVNPQVIDLKTLTKLKKLEDSIKENPENTEAMVTLGNKYFDYGHFKEAIKFYKMYLKKLPNSPNVLVDLGVCYYNLKDYENALKFMKKAVAINPNHQIAYLNLGIVNEAMGNVEEARKYWEKAIKIDPQSQFGLKAQSFLNNSN